MIKLLLDMLTYIETFADELAEQKLSGFHKADDGLYRIHKQHLLPFWMFNNLSADEIYDLLKMKPNWEYDHVSLWFTLHMEN